MTWQSVGTHTFVPTDKAVQVGSFDLAAGQDTIWVRITQLNSVDDWPWSYGILSWRNANGTPLGSIKAYSNRLGEVFRLGNGLPPSDGTGSIWFEPRGFNLGWLKAGFPWELQFEAQAGATGGQVTNYWNRDPVNAVLSPVTAGDAVDLGTGDLSADNSLFSTNGAAVGAAAKVGIRGDMNLRSGLVIRNDGGPTPQSTHFVLFLNSAGGTAGRISHTGDSTIFYGTSSDYRLKQNVSPLDKAIERLRQLKPVRFSYITEPEKVLDGFIAHEAQAVVPESISGKKDGDDIQCIDQSKLVPLLTAALQEAVTRIEALEAAATQI